MQAGSRGGCFEQETSKESLHNSWTCGTRSQPSGMHLSRRELSSALDALEARTRLYIHPGKVITTHERMLPQWGSTWESVMEMLDLCQALKI